jgi:hypothetical protein
MKVQIEVRLHERFLSEKNAATAPLADAILFVVVPLKANAVQNKYLAEILLRFSVENVLNYADVN